MRLSRTSLGAAVAAVLILSAQACDTPQGELLQPDELRLNRSVQAEVAGDELLKAVRQATSRFHSPTQALRAGYVPPPDDPEHPPCVPQMGHHWVNQDLVGVDYDPLQPQVLLYADGPSGRPQLVAVEYVVIDVGQPHPHFGNQPFDVGGTPIPIDHYSLHVWLYEENPEGMFEPFNPNISCPATHTE